MLLSPISLDKAPIHAEKGFHKEKLSQVKKVTTKPVEPVELAEKKPIPKPISPPEPAAVQPSGSCADWIRQAGVAEADVADAHALIMRESGCSPTIANASSGAYGIPQSLPGNKMASHGADWQTNPITQIRWMADYCQSRYGGWSEANQAQLAQGWY